MTYTKKLSSLVLLQKQSIQNVSCPRLSGSKRTTFRGAQRRCKNE